MRGDKDSSKVVASEDAEAVTALQEQGKDQDKEEAVSLEKQQEILLINKMAAGGKLPPKNQSNFLQKKLQQRKFFDSGDYAMQNQKDKKLGLLKQQQAPAAPVVPVIPQPPSPGDQVLPAITKPAEDYGGQGQVSPNLRPNHPNHPMSSLSVASVDGDSDEEGQLQIPRPDTVPQRKASILHPSVHSKLSPLPHIHHDHNDESLTAAPQ